MWVIDKKMEDGYICRQYEEDGYTVKKGIAGLPVLHRTSLGYFEVEHITFMDNALGDKVRKEREYRHRKLKMEYHRAIWKSVGLLVILFSSVFTLTMIYLIWGR